MFCWAAGFISGPVNPVRTILGRCRNLPRGGNGIWLRTVGKWLPGYDAGANLIVLFNRPAGAFLDVWEDQSGVRLVRPPDLEAAGDALSDQGTAGLELRIPCVLDQNRTLEEDAITLPALAPDRGRLYDDAVRLCSHQRHPFPWQAGVDDRRKRNKR